MFNRLFVWNLKSTVRWWWLLSTVALFAVVGLYNVARLNSMAIATDLRASVWDSMFLSFSGPPASAGMIDGLIWLVPQLLLFYFVGDTVRRELVERGESILPLIGSRLIWWIGKVSALVANVFAFFILGFCVVLVVSALALPWSSSWGSLIVSGEFAPSLNNYSIGFGLFLMFLLLVTTGWAVVLVQTVLALYFNSINAFIVVSGLSILAWTSGSYFRTLVFLLPGNQSMFSRHSLLTTGVEGLSIGWSLLYNLVAVIGALMLGAWLLNSMDIVNGDA